MNAARGMVRIDLDQPPAFAVGFGGSALPRAGYSRRNTAKVNFCRASAGVTCTPVSWAISE